MHSGGIFDYAGNKDRLEEVSRELENPDVWNNPANAQALGRERAQLEANLIDAGCALDSLKIWDDALLDGHNRLDFCRKHGLPYSVETVEGTGNPNGAVQVCKEVI